MQAEIVDASSQAKVLSIVFFVRFFFTVFFTIPFVVFDSFGWVRQGVVT